MESCTSMGKSQFIGRITKPHVLPSTTMKGSTQNWECVRWSRRMFYPLILIPRPRSRVWDVWSKKLVTREKAQKCMIMVFFSQAVLHFAELIVSPQLCEVKIKQVLTSATNHTYLVTKVTNKKLHDNSGKAIVRSWIPKKKENAFRIEFYFSISFAI
jgi:hypothetical protein